MQRLLLSAQGHSFNRLTLTKGESREKRSFLSRKYRDSVTFAGKKECCKKRRGVIHNLLRKPDISNLWLSCKAVNWREVSTLRVMRWIVSLFECFARSLIVGKMRLSLLLCVKVKASSCGANPYYFLHRGEGERMHACLLLRAVLYTDKQGG